VLSLRKKSQTWGQFALVHSAGGPYPDARRWQWGKSLRWWHVVNKKNRFEELGRGLGRTGLALMIPTVMAVTPLVGYMVGLWIGRWTGWEPMKFVGLLVGLASGLRQSIDIIRKLSRPE
jgi:hypothetical protein